MTLCGITPRKLPISLNPRMDEKIRPPSRSRGLQTNKQKTAPKKKVYPYPGQGRNWPHHAVDRAEDIIEQVVGVIVLPPKEKQ